MCRSFTRQARKGRGRDIGVGKHRGDEQRAKEHVEDTPLQSELFEGCGGWSLRVWWMARDQRATGVHLGCF